MFSKHITIHQRLKRSHWALKSMNFPGKLLHINTLHVILHCQYNLQKNSIVSILDNKKSWLINAQKIYYGEIYLTSINSFTDRHIPRPTSFANWSLALRPCHSSLATYITSSTSTYKKLQPTMTTYSRWCNPKYPKGTRILQTSST